jgi:CheY-like chemotaxis protein
MNNDQTMPDFIVIDDDPLNNMICQNIINITIPHADVKTFTLPEKGLEHILHTYTGVETKDLVLFLDINMPVLTGWDVLDQINDFPAAVRDRLKIFMLSSSISSSDKERANNDPRVSGYIVKALSLAKMRAIFDMEG